MLAEDMARLRAVRQAVGDGFEIMVDANQCFTLGEALRRAPHYAELAIAWFEEPLARPTTWTGHRRLAAARRRCPSRWVNRCIRPASSAPTSSARRRAIIVQVDVARVGGITPWLKVAHLAEACNLAVAPHFLMELHVSLTTAVPNGAWVEYIPQLDAIASSRCTDHRWACRAARDTGPGHRLGLA